MREYFGLTSADGTRFGNPKTRVHLLGYQSRKASFPNYVSTGKARCPVGSTTNLRFQSRTRVHLYRPPRDRSIPTLREKSSPRQDGRKRPNSRMISILHSRLGMTYRLRIKTLGNPSFFKAPSVSQSGCVRAGVISLPPRIPHNQRRNPERKDPDWQPPESHP